MVTRIDLMHNLTTCLEEVFRGFALPGKDGELKDVQIFQQYLPQPEGIEVGEDAGLKGYAEDDYESNFPCVIIRLEDMVDNEERSLPSSTVDVRILCGICDESPKNTGWENLLKMQDMIREYLLENRIFARKHIMRLPITSKLLDGETWPVYFGEMSIKFSTGRPVQGAGYIYEPRQGGAMPDVRRN